MSNKMYIDRGGYASTSRPIYVHEKKDYSTQYIDTDVPPSMKMLMLSTIQYIARTTDGFNQ